MRRLEQAPSLTEKIRSLEIGEVAKVQTEDCRESVLRNIACRLKKEGMIYRVNAYDSACLITRLA